MTTVGRVHPIEQLRYVARAAGADASLLVQEAASALGVFAADRAGLLTGCRRLLTRQPGIGPLWWMSAQMVTSMDPRQAARSVIEQIRHDATAREIAHALPDGATVVIAGWPDTVLGALRRRGDLNVLVLDIEGQGGGVVRQLDRADVYAEDLDVARLAGAVTEADVVLIEAAVLGPSAALVDLGNTALAAVGQVSGTAVWLVAGIGRRVPEPVWREIVERVTDAEEPAWLAHHEVVALGLVDRVASCEGVVLPSELGPIDFPSAPELLKTLS